MACSAISGTLGSAVPVIGALSSAYVDVSLVKMFHKEVARTYGFTVGGEIITELAATIDPQVLYFLHWFSAN